MKSRISPSLSLYAYSLLIEQAHSKYYLLIAQMM